MKIEKGYKVLRIAKDMKLISPYAHTILALEYRVGEWTYPKVEGSRIFVLDRHLYGAYISRANSMYECEVLNPKHIPVHKIPTSIFQCSCIWAGIENDARLQTASSFLVIAMAWTAEAIRLTKRVL